MRISIIIIIIVINNNNLIIIYQCTNLRTNHSTKLFTHPRRIDA